MGRGRLRREKDQRLNVGESFRFCLLSRRSSSLFKHTHSLMSKKDGTTSSSKSSAVSNVVNDLIRSSLGSEAQNIGDQDLDKYIADLILKEAEAKRKKYDTIGVRAYLPNTGL